MKGKACRERKHLSKEQERLERERGEFVEEKMMGWERWQSEEKRRVAWEKRQLEEVKRHEQEE